MPADLFADLTVGGGAGKLTFGHICSTIDITGDLRSLVTRSALVPGVGVVDYVRQDADPRGDGELVVGGTTGRGGRV